MILKYLRVVSIACLAKQLAFGKNPETGIKSNETTRTYEQETYATEMNCDDNGSISLHDGKAQTTQITLGDNFVRYGLPIVGAGVLILIGTAGAKKANFGPFRQDKKNVPLTKKHMLRSKQKTGVNLNGKPKTSNNQTISATEKLHPTQAEDQIPEIKLKKFKEIRPNNPTTQLQDGRPNNPTAQLQDGRPNNPIIQVQDGRPNKRITAHDEERILKRAETFSTPKENIFLNYEHIDGDNNYTDRYKLRRLNRQHKQLCVERFNSETRIFEGEFFDFQKKFQAYLTRCMINGFADESTIKAPTVEVDLMASQQGERKKIMAALDINFLEFMKTNKREFIETLEGIRVSEWKHVIEIKNIARGIPGNPLGKMLEDMDRCEEQLKRYGDQILLFGQTDLTTAFERAKQFAEVSRNELKTELENCRMIKKKLDRASQGELMDCMDDMNGNEIKILGEWRQRHGLKGGDDIEQYQKKCAEDILDYENRLQVDEKEQTFLLNWLDLVMNHNDLVDKMDGYIESLTTQLETRGLLLVPAVQNLQLQDLFRNLKTRLQDLKKRMDECKQGFEKKLPYTSLKPKLDELDKLFTDKV